LTSQVVVPYTRSGGRIAVSKVYYTEMPGDENAAPLPLFKLFPCAPVAVC